MQQSQNGNQDVPTCRLQIEKKITR